MLVVPEEHIRLKSLFGDQVYAEKWLDLKAGEVKVVRVTSQSIEEVPVAAPTPATSRQD